MFPGSAFKENGIYCWRFVAPDRRRRREVVEFLGVGRRVGVIPLRGAETYVFATCERELLAHRGSGSPEQLRRLFAHFPPPIPDLISGPLDALHFEALGSSVWPCFTRGRVVLIGDAAHAMGPDLAQGASLAMEDAIVLAASLRTESDLASALQIYEGRRVARVGRFAVATKIIGRAAHVTEPLARCVRDRMLYSGLMANWVVSGLLAWGMLDGHDEGTGSAHPTTQ